MVKFKVSSDILVKHPRHFTACFGRLAYEPNKGDFESRTVSIIKECESLKSQHVDLPPEQISEWQSVFKQMGASAKYKSSVTSLWERYTTDNCLYDISPLVNFYNAVSLRFLTPMAAYDADKIEGEIKLRFANKGELFTPLGNPKQNEKTKNGEIVYADDNKIICRYWNLRDCEESKITPRTNSVILFADILASSYEDADLLASKIRDKLGEAFGVLVPYGLIGTNTGSEFSFEN